MDWTNYKAACDQPDVWSRWMLEQALRLLADKPELVAPLRRGLRQPPLPKPAGHKGGGNTDMFRLHLPPATIAAIVIDLGAARARGARTSEGRGLGGFVEAWREYHRFAIRQ